MKPYKTVFIVGAGASSEVGFLSGRKFIDSVSDKLNFQFKGPSLSSESGDQDILDVVQSQYAHDLHSLKSYVAAAQQTREGLVFARSIDSFLDVHRGDRKIQILGKLAIAKTILEQEQQSALYRGVPEQSFRDLKKLNESWFVNLLRGLNDGVRLDEIGRIFEKVAFVIFNYDRCVEYCLYTALQKHYGIDGAAAQSVMQTLTALHPYGRIAKLPSEASDGIPFGFPANRANLLAMFSQIRTYTEQLEDEDLLRAIKSEIAQAETLVFLGFGYLDLNMEVIDLRCECQAKEVYGTALGISENDVQEIKDRIRGLVGRNLSSARMRGPQQEVSERLYIRSDLKCAAILDEYSRSLFLAGKRSGA